jgi:hypothetical protein
MTSVETSMGLPSRGVQGLGETLDDISCDTNSTNIAATAYKLALRSVESITGNSISYV